jgi:hypothetical protein
MRKLTLVAATAALLTAPVAYAQPSLVGGAAGTVTNTVTGTLGRAGATVGGAGSTIGGIGNAAGGAIGGLGGGALGGIGGAVGGAVGGIGGAVGGVGGAIGGVGGAVGGVGGAVGGVGGAVGGVGGVGGGAATAVGLSATQGPLTTGSLGTATGVGSGPGAASVSIPSVSLPAALAPCGDDPRRRQTARISLCGPRYTAYFPEIGSVSGTREDLEDFRNPLRPRPGTPQQVVQDCRTAIVAAALPYGVVRVDAASAGPMQSARGGFVAPVEFRIVYNRRGGLETRQATINCRMNTAGRVVAAA